jgi:hypothetical protein
MVFMLVFYVIPIGFSGWIIPNEFERMIFTTVDPQQLSPLSWLTYNIEYSGIMHTFFGFKFAYLLCIWFSKYVVSLIIEFRN